MQATDCDREHAEMALNACDGHCKTAIVMILTGVDSDTAKALLQQNKGYIRPAIAERS
jgi:N-acetylmuramic acid 6-phosphate etherase